MRSDSVTCTDIDGCYEEILTEQDDILESDQSKNRAGDCGEPRPERKLVGERGKRFKRPAPGDMLAGQERGEQRSGEADPVTLKRASNESEQSSEWNGPGMVTGNAPGRASGVER